MAGRCQAIIGTNFVNWALGNKNKWHWNQNKTIFIPEKENKNVVYKMGVLPSMCYCISYQSHTCMASKHLHRCVHGPLYRYVKLRVAHAPGMPGTFSTPPRVSDPDMHHDTCVTHVPWCMTGSQSSSFLWSRWRGKRSRHSRRMHNPQIYVSGNRPMQLTLPGHQQTQSWQQICT